MSLQGYNIASTTLPAYHISTAMVPRVIPEIGEVSSYETIVWEWNPVTKEVGKMIDQIDHHWEWQARQEHLKIVERYMNGVDKVVSDHD